MLKNIEPVKVRSQIKCTQCFYTVHRKCTISGTFEDNNTTIGHGRNLPCSVLGRKMVRDG